MNKNNFEKKSVLNIDTIDINFERICKHQDWRKKIVYLKPDNQFAYSGGMWIYDIGTYVVKITKILKP